MCTHKDYVDIRKELRAEARKRIAERKLSEGMCLDIDDIQHINKEDRIKLAKFVCRTDFKQ